MLGLDKLVGIRKVALVGLDEAQMSEEIQVVVVVVMVLLLLVVVVVVVVVGEAGDRGSSCGKSENLVVAHSEIAPC